MLVRMIFRREGTKILEFEMYEILRDGFQKARRQALGATLFEHRRPQTLLREIRGRRLGRDWQKEDRGEKRERTPERRTP